jgi:hypothetical protein
MWHTLCAQVLAHRQAGLAAAHDECFNRFNRLFGHAATIVDGEPIRQTTRCIGGVSRSG